MTKTSVSSKFQIVIPKEVRDQMNVKPGQKFVVYVRGGIIHLIPEIPIKKLRGIFKGRGIGMEDLRDKSDRPL